MIRDKKDGGHPELHVFMISIRPIVVFMVKISVFAVIFGKLKEYLSSFSCSWVLVWAAARRRCLCQLLLLHQTAAAFEKG
jgi:hypothetical protein